MPRFARTPVPLYRDIDPEALCGQDTCDAVYTLGSYWPYSRRSFESRVVKGFKECYPAADFEPHISALCEFYASSVVNAVGIERFDWVCRVLSSSETTPDAARPQSLLTAALCKFTGAGDSSHIFYRSGPRPPMRAVQHLSGPDAIRTRIRYATQDLFARPCELGGAALLIDDIMNTGASVRAYARALKDYMGVDRVVAVNLAAMRFGRGKDGHGTLRLDTSGLDGVAGLEKAWLDAKEVFHSVEDCAASSGPGTVGLRFLCERKGQPCEACAVGEPRKRKWWQVW